MNKDDIKKALKFCADSNDCDDCPYDVVRSCSDRLKLDARELIAEQEKEIERLKAENEELTKVVSSKVYDLIDNTKEIADAREAWEKQAKIDVLNELKNRLVVYYPSVISVIDEINNRLTKCDIRLVIECPNKRKEQHLAKLMELLGENDNEDTEYGGDC